MADVGEGDKRFWIASVTPKGGRTLVLWIDQMSHLIDRAELDLAIFHKTIRYGAYQQFDGLTLPTTIASDLGDPSDVDRVTVQRWTVTLSWTMPLSSVYRPPRTPVFRTAHQAAPFY